MCGEEGRRTVFDSLGVTHCSDSRTNARTGTEIECALRRSVRFLNSAADRRLPSKPRIGTLFRQRLEGAIRTTGAPGRTHRAADGASRTLRIRRRACAAPLRRSRIVRHVRIVEPRGSSVQPRPPVPVHQGVGVVKPRTTGGMLHCKIVGWLRRRADVREAITAE